MQFDLNDKKLNNPFYSVRCLLKGLRLLIRPGLRHFVWIPLLINLVLYALALWLAIYYFSDFLNWLIPSWLDWLRWLLWPIFAVTFFIATFFSFTLIANLIASPFYGRLAEKTESMLTGQAIKALDEESWSRGAVKDVLAELSRLGYFVVRAIPLLILFLIPGINLLAPFLWLLFNAWFLALEYTAYPLEVHGIRFPQQRKMMKKLSLGAMSFGGIAMFGLTVPLLNILISPAAVIGATAYFIGSQTHSPAVQPAGDRPNRLLNEDGPV